MLRLVRPEEVIDPEVLDGFRTSLTVEELERIGGFASAQDRHVRLVAWGMLRSLLAEQYRGVAPSEFRFRVNGFGKPFLAQPEQCSEIQFNLSVCDGLIAILIADGRHVGVDVEGIRPLDNLMEMAEQFFAAAEVDDLRKTPEADRLERFFRYWTLKEAYVKARGLGLSVPLDQFWFELDHVPRIRFAEGFKDDPSNWEIRQEFVSPRFWLATAIERRL
jgi:4'-phosphopantetheinyl transferase